jgi:hypothetical protein
MGLGLCAALLAYRGIRFWKTALLLPSIYVAVVNVPPMVTHTIESRGLKAWFEVWREVGSRMIERGEAWAFISGVYNVFAWPFLHVAVILAVSYIWLKETSARNRAEWTNSIGPTLLKQSMRRQLIAIDDCQVQE